MLRRDWDRSGERLQNRERVRKIFLRKVFFSELHVRFDEIRLHANGLAKSTDGFIVLSESCTGKAQIGVRLNEIRLKPHCITIGCQRT